ncbi:synaptogyrin-4 isoform X3 [Panthera leo]|uniref:synaptogyrin-4 isoform X3 n=1 Tax=Panthera leo TaxID=9689 RepID=UPI001C6A8E51|nr:synaptogyrin-4 isoform X3 [Panthera leo]
MHIPESLQDLADSEAVQFLKRPKTITRIFAGVFSLVVFSSLLTDGHQNNTESSRLHCILNSNSTACGFAVGAGLLAFLTCLAFLALDTQESRIGSSRFKTAFQLLDFILAGPSTPLLSCGPPSPVDRHLVRGFLLPGQPVAALTPRRAPPGKQQRQGRHHLHFLLRPRLGIPGLPGPPGPPERPSSPLQALPG